MDQNTLRPAGTPALIYAVLSFAALLVAAFGALAWHAGILAVIYAGVSMIGALIIGLVRRLAGGEPVEVSVGRMAIFALGGPAALLVLAAFAG